MIDHKERIVAAAVRWAEHSGFAPDAEVDLLRAVAGYLGRHSKDAECPVCDGPCAAMPPREERLAANNALFAAWEEYAEAAGHPKDDQATRRILCGVALGTEVRSCGLLEPEARRKCAAWFRRQTEAVRLSQHDPGAVRSGSAGEAVAA
jgi:hypothetical protein